MECLFYLDYLFITGTLSPSPQPSPVKGEGADPGVYGALGLDRKPPGSTLPHSHSGGHA
jgi:hypothetical protein